MDNEQTTTPLAGSPIPAKCPLPGPPKWRSCRFLLAYLILGGNAVLFLQRVSFSMVIVCMVNHTALDLLHLQAEQLYLQRHLNQSLHGQEGGNESGWTSYSRVSSQPHPEPTITVVLGSDSSVGDGDAVYTAGAGNEGDTCDTHNATGAQAKEDGPFVWSKETQGLLLGALYWGYMTAQVLGGYLFLLFGPRGVAAVSMLSMALLTMLCHPAALWSPWAVFVLRVAMGVCTSFTMPSLYAIWGKWAPKGERTTLISLSFSGQNVANSLAFPIAALLCKYGFAGGWPSVFYVCGILGVVWCLSWVVFVSDTPETSRWIQPEERDYIVSHRGQVSEDKEKIRVPWCRIFTSICVWAIVVAQVTFTWGLFLFLSNLPLYLYEVMKFDIQSNGFYSMLPYLALLFVQMTGGFFTDFIARRQFMSVFWLRRFVTALASLVPAILLLIMSYLDCTQVAAMMLLLTASVGFMGFAFSGFLVNAFDIAPQYAVSIMSMSTTFACMPGIVTPYVVAHVTQDKTREQWQIVFFITGAVYLFGTIFFCLFARTSVLSWARPPDIAMDMEDPAQVVDKTGCRHTENGGHLLEKTTDDSLLSDTAIKAGKDCGAV